MEMSQYCALLSAAFAGGLISYEASARRNGWPVGSIFTNGGAIPGAIFLGVMVWLLGVSGAWAWHGKASWWWLLWIVLSSFLGGAFLTPIFRTWSGAVSLIAAPVLAVLAVLV